MVELQELTNEARMKSSEYKSELNHAASASRQALKAAEDGADRVAVLEQEVQTVLAAHLETTAQSDVVASALEQEMQVAVRIRSERDQEGAAAQRLRFEHEQALVCP